MTEWTGHEASTDALRRALLWREAAASVALDHDDRAQTFAIEEENK